MKDLSLKIQQAASQLFFRTGIKHVSMDDLSKTLKISKKTLYNCFSNKNELVEQTVNQHFTTIEHQLESIARLQVNAISKMLKATAFAVEQLSMVNPSMIQDLLKYYPDIYQQMLKRREVTITKQMLDNIRNGREEGLYRFDFNEDLISQLFAHQMIYITEHLSAQGSQIAVNAVQEFALYHLRGIATESGFNELQLLKSNEII